MNDCSKIFPSLNQIRSHSKVYQPVIFNYNITINTQNKFAYIVFKYSDIMFSGIVYLRGKHVVLTNICSNKFGEINSINKLEEIKSNADNLHLFEHIEGFVSRGEFYIAINNKYFKNIYYDDEDEDDEEEISNQHNGLYELYIVNENVQEQIKERTTLALSAEKTTENKKYLPPELIREVGSYLGGKRKTKRIHRKTKRRKYYRKYKKSCKRKTI